MSISDHIALLDTLQKIRGYAVLCGYNHPLYRSGSFTGKSLNSRHAIPSRIPGWSRCGGTFDDQGRKIVNDPEWIRSRFIEVMGGLQAAEVLVKRTGMLMQLAKLKGIGI